MASNNIYEFEFVGKYGKFDEATKKAGESFEKFSGKIKGSSMKVSSSFDGMIRAFGYFKIAMKGFDILADLTKKFYNSTAEGQREWNNVMEGGKAAVNAFWQSLATGDFTGFISNMTEAYNLTVKYQTSLNNFKVTNFIAELNRITNNSKIAALELAKVQA
jgi:hypothetical protein